MEIKDKSTETDKQGESVSVEKLVSRFKLTTKDVNNTCDMMFESKLNKLVRKLPRSHLLILRCVERWYTQIKQRDANNLSESELLKIYNTQMTKEMGVERISVG